LINIAREIDKLMILFYSCFSTFIRIIYI